MIARLKVDEDLPSDSADVLSANGHDATTVLEQGWKGLPDEILWSRIQTEGRWLVTADKAFADLRRYPPGSHGGVILLRSEPENRHAYTELTYAAVRQLNLDEISGSVVVVTTRGVRVRRAPT